MSGPSTDSVEVVPYDPAWPELFAAESARLRSALGRVAVRIDHVGSTAVVGLAAKPVIDIQISVRALEPPAPYMEPLERLGYGHWRDVHEEDHRFCRDEPRRHHVHLVIAGGEAEPERPLFRDYLRAHPARAGEYAELKAASALCFGHDRDAYTNSKNEFIQGLSREARSWAKQSSWTVRGGQRASPA